LVKFWIKSGLSISDTSLEHAFSDFDYVEMVCDTERVTTPPSFETNPTKVVVQKVVGRKVEFSKVPRGPALGDVSPKEVPRELARELEGRQSNSTRLSWRF
jgi:hypothetical protein